MLELACAKDSGPKKLGPWLIHRALVGSPRLGNAAPAGYYPSSGASPGNTAPGTVMPGDFARAGTTPAAAGVGITAEQLASWKAEVTAWNNDAEGLSSARGLLLGDRLVKLIEALDGNTPAPAEELPPVSERLIVDLCAGSGSWSEPYKRAGYQVQRFTLPSGDVRVLPAFDRPVWGVLAAPPCTEFSLAKNGQDRDLEAGTEVVSACIRLIWTASPRWWALENPVGLLGRFLGRPADVFDPCDFGDPWTKRTALWGHFNAPVRGTRVTPIDGGGPICSICYPDDPRVCGISDHRAVTPPGFAQAFFEANP